MKAKISELMDGELEGAEAGRLVSLLREEGEPRETWRTYHMIGDALRDLDALSAGFSERLRERLAGEPTVLAPARLPETGGGRGLRGWLMPAAAGAAAVAMVGYLAFPLERDASPGGVVPVAVVPAAQPAPVAAAAELASVPPPAGADDYLLAHQNFASRSLPQRVAPYVRTVSGRLTEHKR